MSEGRFSLDDFIALPGGELEGISWVESGANGEATVQHLDWTSNSEEQEAMANVVVCLWPRRR